MVYVANFCDIHMFEAFEVDPDTTLEMMASPQFVSVSTELSEEWFEYLRSEATKEFLEVYGLTQDDGVVPPELVWSTELTELDYPMGSGRPNTCLFARDKQDGDLLIQVVIQEVAPFAKG